jgi:hypothetical protein
MMMLLTRLLLGRLSGRLLLLLLLLLEMLLLEEVLHVAVRQGRGCLGGGHRLRSRREQLLHDALHQRLLLHLLLGRQRQRQRSTGHG